MSENKKLSEKFLEVLQHEGVVSVVSWGVETHVANTWNSYLVVTEDERILIPAYGFRKTEKNVDVNNKVKLTENNRSVCPGIGIVYRCTKNHQIQLTM